jgi:hypothetical protein
VSDETDQLNNIIVRCGARIMQRDQTAVEGFEQIADMVAALTTERDALKAVVETLVELWETAVQDDHGKVINEGVFAVLVHAGRNALALGERPPGVNSQSSTSLEQ